MNRYHVNIPLGRWKRSVTMLIEAADADEAWSIARAMMLRELDSGNAEIGQVGNEVSPEYERTYDFDLRQ